MFVKMPSRTTINGFTLLELLVAIAVLAIIMGIAVPSFMSAMINARLTTTANDFLAALQLARTEAMRAQGRVTICKASAAATQCDASSTTDWARGWMIFTDPVPQSPSPARGG